MTMKISILVVDDEEIVLKSCTRIFTLAGYEVDTAGNGREALRKIGSHTYDLVLTDMVMPELDGMGLLREIVDSHPELVVIMFTGYSSVNTAVDAMKSGAADYIPKPFTPDELLTKIQIIIDERVMPKIVMRKAPNIGDKKEIDNIIGSSPKMQEVFIHVRKAAATNCTVLIMGESGTGKELIADAIHELSKRKNEKFVAVDCTVLHRELLESELFGHVKGAFTGAIAEKRGLFEVADKGTIFLDEIGDVGPEFQGKLLRVLQERTFKKVGGTIVQKVNVRFIFATNKDLQDLVRINKFREDLFYRVYVFPIILPPLRERREDIPLLVNYFLNKYSGIHSDSQLRISDEAMDKLTHYEWPGNVRQLENVIERMVILTDTGILTPGHLPREINIWPVRGDYTVPRTNVELKNVRKRIKNEAISDIERLFVLNALERNKWNVTKAAEDVRMQRPNFHALMKKLNIRSKENN